MFVHEKAFAKINLYLKVEDKREDGYHNLETIMQSVSLFDDLSFSHHEDIVLHGGVPDIKNDNNNLIYKAAKVFLNALDIKTGVKVDYKKRIPHMAGLAGGSTDAAATLRGLNRLYKTNLNVGQLQDLALSVGSDVPFCVSGGTALCRGRGEIITPLEMLPEVCFIISKGGSMFSTREIFANRQSNYRVAKPLELIMDGIKNKDLLRISKGLYNDFEVQIGGLDKDIKHIKNIMTECGAIASNMSGTGPAVFGLFTESQSAYKAQQKLQKLGFDAYFCYPTPPVLI